MSKGKNQEMVLWIKGMVRERPIKGRNRADLDGLKREVWRLLSVQAKIRFAVTTANQNVERPCTLGHFRNLQLF